MNIQGGAMGTGAKDGLNVNSGIDHPPSRKENCCVPGISVLSSAQLTDSVRPSCNFGWRRAQAV